MKLGYQRIKTELFGPEKQSRTRPVPRLLGKSAGRGFAVVASDIKALA